MSNEERKKYGKNKFIVFGVFWARFAGFLRKCWGYFLGVYSSVWQWKLQTIKNSPKKIEKSALNLPQLCFKDEFQWDPKIRPDKPQRTMKNSELDLILNKHFHHTLHNLYYHFSCQMTPMTWHHVTIKKQFIYFTQKVIQTKRK